MIDVWRFNLEETSEYWNQPAPNQLRQLYREVLSEFGHSGVQSIDRSKVLALKSMGRLLNGGNPLTTWRCLSRQCPQLTEEAESTVGVAQDAQAEIIKRFRDDIRKASIVKVNE